MSGLQQLSRREREIMDVVYAKGEATVAEALEGLKDPPSYSAVRTLMRILEEKGHLRHRELEKKYVYSPVMTREKAAKGALERVLETFFGGSLELAVATRLTDPKVKLTKEEYKRLAALIEAAKKKGE
ncbi:MAG: BlaI/MecI/CopY family transcriptional regulator [Phycisphaerales bacterium]|nr:BlaI/MecI/CopY family transcriptional regulator [Phycisphaerales bacterium]